MANNTETQKPKERVKYKFGQSDIDLTNYIHNLGTNVQSYLNSKNWNDGQKQEFMNAYNRYLTGLQDQLANNTNRFTTDDFGSIIDSTGALSNTDNDDIDPVGSEYYYDDKGNRITTDDFNALKKRKQKNYNTFSANREVATYFNAIGNALRSKQPTKEQTSNAFDLSKHGFLADWTRINNPAGGNLNLDPYLEKDAVDEATGKRGTTNRAAYLKEQIENYINNIGDYDFSSTPFKDRNTYVSRLRAAAENLGNGYNSEDVIALNQAGIGNEFLSKFFSTGAEEPQAKQSELERQAEQSAQELAQKEAEKQQRIDQKVEETGKTREQVEAAERRPMEEGFSTIDKVRLGTAAADAISAAAAFIPGYGTVASGVLGIGSTLTNIGADIADESMSGWDVAGNALYGLVMDAVGLIPGMGATGKAAKIVRVLKPVSKLAMRTLQAYGMVHSADAFNKLMSNPSDMSADDWRNLVTGLQAISGEARYKGGKRAVSRATTQRDVADVKTSTGRMATISKEDLDKLRETKGLKAQNKLFSELTGGQKLQREFKGREFKGREFNWKQPWKSRLHSDNPEFSTRTESTFLPEDTSWDARLFRGMQKKEGNSKKKPSQQTTASNFDRLRNLSSQTGKLTPQEIATINRQRVKSGKGKLTQQEIEALNQRRSNRAGSAEDNSIQARLARYKQDKKDGKFNSVEDDIKRAKDKLAEATRQQRLAVPTGQGSIVSPDAKEARFIMGLSKTIPTVSPSRPPITNPPAIIPRQQIEIPKPQTTPFNSQRIREGLERAQRAIESNPERTARLQAQEAYRNVRQYFNMYGVPQYKKPLTGAARRSKQNTYNQLFGEGYYAMQDALRNRPLPHKQSNKKKKTSRDDRRTVKREEGGILDKVRKFDGGGITETARKATQYALNNNWFTNLYNQKSLTGWDSSKDASKAGVSITNQNASHGNAGDLSIPFYKNLTYTSQSNLVGQDLQSYYNSAFQGKSLEDYVNGYNANAAKIRGYWDQERAYRQAGASEHNRLFKNMFGNRSNNSNDVWNIGYDPKLDDVVGSSTWLRRMDRYEKEFDALSDEEKKARVHKIDLGGGNVGYVYKKANGDIAIWNEPVAPEQPTEPTKPASTTTVIGPEQPKKEGDTREMFSFLRNINPTIAYGLPRAVYADRMNRRMTDLAKASVTPLLKDPFQVHRYTRSDLDAEMQGERNYANLRRLASRPITSDGSLQTATQLQAEVQGQEARTAGKEKSNQTQRQYDELAWQQEKENAANRHETAMFNRAQQWGADQDKSKFEQAYLSKKFNIWDTFGQQLEYDARTKQQENKALADNFARSDIHNAVNYAPNDYGANLTPEELTVWNKVLSGTNPSSLSTQEFNSYRLAAQKVSRVETDQLRQHYNIPNTRWSGKAGVPNTPWSASISFVKKGGIISAKNGSKIAVAGIEAKTADAERFQKQIKDCIDRNEKTLDRLSKSLYGLIKASMIK